MNGIAAIPNEMIEDAERKEGLIGITGVDVRK